MLSWDRIEQLVAFESGDHRVLSVYLDLGRCPSRRASLIPFRRLVQNACERCESIERCALLREATSLQDWLSSTEVAGPALVAFSCASEGLWQREFLQVRVPTHLAFERRADLAPLVDVLENASRALRELLPHMLSDRLPIIMDAGQGASDLETMARALEVERRVELALVARRLASRLEARVARLRRPLPSRAGQE